MTQEEFNAMLQVALAQGLPGGYCTSKYGGEGLDALLDKVKAMTTKTTEEGAT